MGNNINRIISVTTVVLYILHVFLDRILNEKHKVKTVHASPPSLSCPEELTQFLEL